MGDQPRQIFKVEVSCGEADFPPGDLDVWAIRHAVEGELEGFDFDSPVDVTVQQLTPGGDVLDAA
jgi:hypothetical protein